MIRVRTDIVHGNGIDLRRRQLCRHRVELLPAVSIARKLLRSDVLAVSLLRQGRVLKIPVVVAGTCKEGSHLINGFPVLPDLVVHGDGHQQGAPVQIFLTLPEIQAAEPHHGAEIGFQLFIALVVAADDVLGVIFVVSGESGFKDLTVGFDPRELLFDDILDLLRRLCRRVQKPRAHGEECHIPLCGIFPLGPRQRLHLRFALLQHRGAELLQPLRQEILLRLLLQHGEIEMIGVHHRIHGDEVRHNRISVALIRLPEFVGTVLGDEKSVLRQHLLRVVLKIIITDVRHVPEIRVHGIILNLRLHLRSRLILRRKKSLTGDLRQCCSGPLFRRSGLLRGGFLRFGLLRG